MLQTFNLLYQVIFKGYLKNLASTCSKMYSEPMKEHTWLVPVQDSVIGVCLAHRIS